MSQKLISVVIPTYNRAHLIAETLDSIKAQTHTNWECIVVDDGGTDNTSDLLDKYMAADTRFRYVVRPAHYQKGANACRNYGYELSHGDYVKWFDSDDIMHPQFLSKQLEFLEKHPTLDFVASFSKIFVDTPSAATCDFNPQETQSENPIYSLIVGKLFFLTPAPLWRKSFLAGKTLFDVTLHNAHEADFHFRMFLAGAQYQYQQETLFFVRRGHASIDFMANKDVNSIQSQFDYFEKIYVALRENPIFSGLDTDELQWYTLYRKAIFYHSVVQFGKSAAAKKDFKLLFRQFLDSRMPVAGKIKYLIGLFLIQASKKGYRFIYQKKFDLREPDRPLL